METLTWLRKVDANLTSEKVDANLASEKVTINQSR